MQALDKLLAEFRLDLEGIEAGRIFAADAVDAIESRILEEGFRNEVAAGDEARLKCESKVLHIGERSYLYERVLSLAFAPIDGRWRLAVEYFEGATLVNRLEGSTAWRAVSPRTIEMTIAPLAEAELPVKLALLETMPALIEALRQRPVTLTVVSD